MSDERKVMRWTSGSIYAAPDVGGFVAYGDYLALESEVAALRQQVEGMREDAERYQWIRRPDSNTGVYLATLFSDERLDAAIDLARKESSK